MNIIGTIDLQTKLFGSNQYIIHKFRVLDVQSYNNIICGRDLMKNFSTVEFDFMKNRIRVGKHWITGITTGKQVVRLCDNITLTPRSEKVIQVQANERISLLQSDFVPKQIPGVSGVYASKAKVIPDVKGQFLLTLLNTNVDSVHLKKKQVIGKLLPESKTFAVLYPSNIPENSDNCEPNFRVDSVAIGKNLSNHETVKIKELLKEFSDVFAVNPKKPRRTTLEHRIITPDALPVYIKPRRCPAAWEKDIETQIDTMLKNDIIRPSTSPWNSPIILVKKKNGENRFVCDYRGLNHVTKKDTYPLPHVKDVLDKMHGSKYWSTLDAASAYWAMPLREVDKEKTAFSVKRGKFEFNVTPFGICNAVRS